MRPRLAQELEEATCEWMASAPRPAQRAQRAQQAQQPSLHAAALAVAAECSNNAVRAMPWLGSAALVALAALNAGDGSPLALEVAASALEVEAGEA